ncbi:MAG TPA: nuclear transport factor 2 family protein [Candidatus Binataceae bacterium]
MKLGPNGKLVGIGLFVAAWMLVLAVARSYGAQGAPADQGAAQKEVRDATLKFYVALNSAFGGDLDPINPVWSHASDVSMMGPLGGRAVGWNEVYAQFQSMGRMNLGARITPADIVVVVDSDLAYSFCDERGEARDPRGGTLKFSDRATNIFRREDGKWKMIHYHADSVPELSQR